MSSAIGASLARAARTAAMTARQISAAVLPRLLFDARRRRSSPNSSPSSSTASVTPSLYAHHDGAGGRGRQRLRSKRRAGQDSERGPGRRQKVAGAGCRRDDKHRQVAGIDHCQLRLRAASSSRYASVAKRALSDVAHSARLTSATISPAVAVRVPRDGFDARLQARRDQARRHALAGRRRRAPARSGCGPTGWLEKEIAADPARGNGERGGS